MANPANFFTPANARQYALKSIEARKAKQAAKNSANGTFAPNRSPAPILDDYAAKRLIRVRALQKRIDDMLAKETDPQALDRLASASARLNDQEFALAQRPKPGSRRPLPERAPRPALPTVLGDAGQPAESPAESQQVSSGPEATIPSVPVDNPNPSIPQSEQWPG